MTGDIPFNASYKPVFRPDTTGGSGDHDQQQLSISAGSSARKAHFRRLYDIWQLSVQRGNLAQARRAYSLLVRFSEFEWATNWRTGIAMVHVEGDDSDNATILDAQVRYLRECHAVHSRPATARAATREPIAVLLQLVLLLIHHHRYQQALSELELYLHTYPYRDDAGLHEYAGMLAVSLAQIEALQISQQHAINNGQQASASTSSNTRKRRHSNASSSSSSSSSSSESSSSDNENSAPSSTQKTNPDRTLKGKFRASQSQPHQTPVLGASSDDPALPPATMMRRLPSVKTVQRIVQDAPNMIMDARRYFERAIEISSMAMEDHDDVHGMPGLANTNNNQPSELAEMWLDLLNGKEPTERIIHQAPPTPKASKFKDKDKSRRQKTRSVSAATASTAALQQEQDDNEDDDVEDDENDKTISGSLGRPTFGSLERQFAQRQNDQEMLSD